MFKRNLARFALATALGAAQAYGATPEDVDNSFFPYRDSVPQFAGLSAGMTINSGNVGQFQEILDPAIFQQVRDGWLDITVGETTSFDRTAFPGRTQHG